MLEIGRAKKRNDIGKRPLTDAERLDQNFDKAVGMLVESSLPWLDVYHGQSKRELAEHTVNESALPPYSFAGSVAVYLGEEPVTVGPQAEQQVKTITEPARVTSPTKSQVPYVVYRANATAGVSVMDLVKKTDVGRHAARLSEFLMSDVAFNPEAVGDALHAVQMFCPLEDVDVLDGLHQSWLDRTQVSERPADMILAKIPELTLAA